MLTGYQVETIAALNEDSEFLCIDCWERSGDYARPVSRYELDEHDTAMSDYEGEDDHVEACGCTRGVYCDSCATELVEPYADPDCEEKQEASYDAR